MAQIEDLEDQVDALETTLGSISGMVGTFEGELARMRDTMTFTGREAERLSTSIGGGVRSAFNGLVFDGDKLSTALKAIGQSITQAVYKTATKPVESAVGSLITSGMGALMGGAMPFAKGGAFSQGRVIPFATGGIVAQPTTFPMRGATGLMGEAGAEAIMPLTRGADGRLGVQSSGGRAVNITMNVTTPDVAGFQRSQGQIAAQVSRALSRGQRNR